MKAIFTIIYFLIWLPGFQKPKADSTQLSEKTTEVYKGSNVLLVSSTNKDQYYAGEIITVTYKLLSKVTVQDAKIISGPLFIGFNPKEFKFPAILQPEAYKGQTYQSVVLKKIHLIAGEAGKIEIEPLKVSANIEAPADPDDFFSVERYDQFTLSSQLFTVKVLPLPVNGKDAPSAVGNFKFLTEVSNLNPELGSAITFKVAISGIGNFLNIFPPEINLPKNVEIYQPSVSINEKVEAGGLKTVYLFEYKFLPTDTGIFFIPSLKFLYFNPDQGKYVTIVSDEYSIIVKPGPKLADFPDPNNFSDKKIFDHSSNGISLLTLDAINSSNRGKLFFGSISFYFLIFFPLSLAALAFIYQISLRHSLQSLAKRKMAIKKVRKSLATLNLEPKRATFEQVGLIVKEYLINRLNLEGNYLTTNEIKRTLNNQNIPVSLTDELVELLLEGYAVSYGNRLITMDLEKYKNKVVDVLNNIDKLLK